MSTKQGMSFNSILRYGRAGHAPLDQYEAPRRPYNYAYLTYYDDNNPQENYFPVYNSNMIDIQRLDDIKTLYGTRSASGVNDVSCDDYELEALKNSVIHVIMVVLNKHSVNNLKILTKLPITKLFIDYTRSTSGVLINIPNITTLIDVNIDANIIAEDRTSIPYVIDIQSKNLLYLSISNVTLDINAWRAIHNMRNLLTLSLQHMTYATSGHGMALDLSTVPLSVKLLNIESHRNDTYVNWDKLHNNFISLMVTYTAAGNQDVRDLFTSITSMKELKHLDVYINGNNNFDAMMYGKSIDKSSYKSIRIESRGGVYTYPKDRILHQEYRDSRGVMEFLQVLLCKKYL